ncbi:hypothetical protein XBKB1_1080003 [Xenorhabdus bovienii str. kraussei Becker Underwood]|uniref:Uncharacterized protein n=1 Tax=Xenorhabdus bovienii str. kraussei Becker Underwood TaxID=1398204 RepID=A0A077PD31_XENBV|nr:hypothetical protein XBKB1_1080003 [Xenorhabdus bovienii str. kraussei Becker Underwood]
MLFKMMKAFSNPIQSNTKIKYYNKNRYFILVKIQFKCLFEIKINITVR